MRQALALLWFVACQGTGAANPATIELKVRGHAVQAEVADTLDERAQGLMERESLVPDHGMLFVYADEQQRSFWMKNTPLPLSIAFIDAGGRVVHLTDMQPLSKKPVLSRKPAKYALEMTKGWFTDHGVRVGAQVTGLPPAPAL